MDKQWKFLAVFFIHRVPTGHVQFALDLLAEKIVFKSLNILVIIKLCTGKDSLNNNNKLTISNIY